VELSTDLAARLREALLAADYTVDTVRARLGAEADAALLRNETTPARRALRGDDSPLATLVQLFLVQESVWSGHAERAFPGGLHEELKAAGVLGSHHSEWYAELDVRPYSSDDTDLWVTSDLTPGLDGTAQRVGPDHVLGISPASTSLAQLTVRTPVASALDLGTGCSVQALHLATHSGRVVATDVNQRALALTRFNAALNEVAVDVRDGSLYEPVRGERFDLVATNPPFVISPATEERLVYRDSGLPGDQVVETIVRDSAAHLSERGLLQVLANWAVRRDQPWGERVQEWLPAGTDAFVVQRELVDPAAYVELWLKDSGDHPSTGGDAERYRMRYDSWLGWFDEQGIEGVGFGWLTVRNGGTGRYEALEWPYEVEQPVAPYLAQWFDPAPAGPEATLSLRVDVVQETRGPAGAEDPETIVLRQQRGLRRARTADTVVAALAGASDGELTVGQLLDAIADLLDEDREAVREDYLPVVAEMAAEGYLVAT
jgi:hypothetical protein